MYPQLGQWKNAAINLATLAQGGGVLQPWKPPSLLRQFSASAVQGYAGTATAPQLCSCSPYSVDVKLEAELGKQGEICKGS